MSTQVTVHRMVTTTTTSAFLVNIGYLKTFPGILKIFQIILGCVAVGITGHYIHWTSRSEYVVPELFFLLIATACLITTSLLLFSCLCSIATSSIMPKTLFETMYHIVASLLYFASALYLLIHLTNKTYRDNQYVAKTAASVVLLHGTLSYLLVCSSINLLREVVARNEGYKIYERGYNSKIFSGALGLVNCALYVLSSIYSVRTFRRG
ncbi:uncharacterized protein LOC121879967 [Homarus americanus]|uniref:uncharacterized protein LOC121879967 n=1 Tax=Homarus americanus TaxID=6706 RepID=UPI001C43CB45|nr:uncharacterized protein LOC121879967 [Homarus americanus]XP_042242777.1 uncharacterized protein LOC121879967 [Homarus americanus]XP_042242786.1 uncharacterized protein LOC121879967 [Homarus americanus]XP_042242791.1 uncharacterized protein LOC121879967 [Homarus americanus]